MHLALHRLLGWGGPSGDVMVLRRLHFPEGSLKSLEQTVPHQTAPDPGTPANPPRLAGDQVQPLGLGGSAAQHPPLGEAMLGMNIPRAWSGLSSRKPGLTA